MKKTIANLTYGGLGGLITFFAIHWISVYAKQDAPLPKITVQDTPLARDTKLTTSFAPIIKKASTSVVNIFTTKNVKELDPRSHPLFNNPLFRDFFGDPDEEEPGPGQGNSRRPRSRQEQSLGSGVIVSEDGYILTNNHVVEGADEIKVVATTGKEYTAKLIGADPATDSAVLKIEATGLPAIILANSDNLEVGDVVLAIGNPFGIGQTVTMGIISAVGRGDLDIVNYEDFIQTDASINPGNSGGALIDAEGRLIGINTAILSRTGGNQGVGFAVPINMSRLVMEGLLKNGKVSRGLLGVNIQPVTPDLAREFKLPDLNGALVSMVPENTPAAEAGIQAGDVIIEFNGKKVSDSRHLRLMVSQTAPKTESTVKLIREGKEKTFKVTLAELTPKDVAGELRRDEKPEAESEALDGVEVTDLDSKARRQFGIPANIKGALVTNVDPDSTSAAAGLRPGDVVQEINHKTVADAQEAIDMSAKIKTERVLLRVWSRGGSRFVTVETHKKESSRNRGKNNRNRNRDRDKDNDPDK